MSGQSQEERASEVPVSVPQDLVPAFAISLADAKERIRQLQEFVASQMVKDVDYGVINGTERPALLKPGAEKLTMMYGFTVEMDVTQRVENWDKGFFHYEVQCTLRNKRNGIIEAMGFGSCNSMEARYRYRWVWPNEVPDSVNKANLPKKKFKGKKGQELVKYRMVNDDPYTLVNTFLKMAEKRAHVDAILKATRSSGLFTQDEDIIRDTNVVDGDVVDQEPPANRGKATGGRGSRSSGRRSQSGQQQEGGRTKDQSDRRITGDEARELVKYAADRFGWSKEQLVEWFRDFMQIQKPGEMKLGDCQKIWQTWKQWEGEDQAMAEDEPPENDAEGAFGAGDGEGE